VNIVAKHVDAKTMTTMAVGVLLHWTQANSSELVVVKSMGVRRGVKTEANPVGAIASPKTYELTLFTMIVYNSENSIRNTRPFCHPLFCHRCLAKWTSSLLQ